MGFLAPALLLAAVAVAVPLALHLFQRRDPRRVPFPAIRYLQRAEREHARSIRLRQILLLALRMLAVLLLAAAAARLYLRTGSASHDPTALALVLDNSLSSGLVRNDRRVLDELRARALETLDAAGPDDRIWVIRAGEPWDVARPVGPEAARRRVMETRPSSGSSDLGASLEQAASLVLASGLPAGEVQLLSDLQSSAFPGDERLEIPDDLPVVTLLPQGDPAANRWVDEVGVAGGLPPLEGEPSELVVRVDAFPATADSISVRMFRAGRVRAAGAVLPGSEVILDLGPSGRGTVTGRVEIDPDALRADDRRYFAFRIRPPSRVYLADPRDGAGARKEATDFVRQGLAVLEEAGRIRTVSRGGEAQVALLRGEVETRGVPGGTPSVVIPPSDPTLLPAFNHGLTLAGIPWELHSAQAGAGNEARVRRSDLPVDLSDIHVRRYYRLRPLGDAPSATRVELSTGDAWLVSGRADRGPYLLLASSLEPGATDLPVRASMIPFLQWSLAAWPAANEEGRELTVGDPLPSVDGATALEAPDGTVHRLDGTRSSSEARIPGIYRLLRGDTLLDVAAVNTPSSESRLSPLPLSGLRAVVGPGLVPVPEPSAWGRSIFNRRKGPELWRPLLVAAFLVLLVESLLATGGRSLGSRSPDRDLREESEGGAGAPV